MTKRPTRRTFLQTAPLLAAAGLALADQDLFAAAPAGGQAAPPEAFQLIPAGRIQEGVKTLAAKPGNDNLFESKTLPFTVVLTVEEKKAAKEFEFHEGRDHIFQILEGTTQYELGGTPQTPRKVKPGEWLAPDSSGARTVMLKKGDMLVIPRGTPHRRTTDARVTFTLISTTGVLPA